MYGGMQENSYIWSRKPFIRKRALSCNVQKTAFMGMTDRKAFSHHMVTCVVRAATWDTSPTAYWLSHEYQLSFGKLLPFGQWVYDKSRFIRVQKNFAFKKGLAFRQSPVRHSLYSDDNREGP